MYRDCTSDDIIRYFDAARYRDHCKSNIVTCCSITLDDLTEITCRGALREGVRIANDGSKSPTKPIDCTDIVVYLRALPGTASIHVYTCSLSQGVRLAGPACLVSTAIGGQNRLLCIHVGSCFDEPPHSPTNLCKHVVEVPSITIWDKTKLISS